MKTFFLISITLAIFASTQSERHPELSVNGLVDEIFELPLSSEKEVIQAFRTIYSKLGENSQISFLIDGLFEAIQDRIDEFSATKGLDSLPFSDFLEKGIEFQNELLEATGQLPQTPFGGLNNGQYYGAMPSLYSFYPQSMFYNIPRTSQGFRGMGFQPYGLFMPRTQSRTRNAGLGNGVDWNSNIEDSTSNLETLINDLESSVDEDFQPEPESEPKEVSEQFKETKKAKSELEKVEEAGTRGGVGGIDGKNGTDGADRESAKVDVSTLIFPKPSEKDLRKGSKNKPQKLRSSKVEKNAPQPETPNPIETLAENITNAIEAGGVRGADGADGVKGADGADGKAIEADCNKPSAPARTNSTSANGLKKKLSKDKGKAQNAKSPIAEEEVRQPGVPKPIETPVAENPAKLTETETPVTPSEISEPEASPVDTPKIEVGKSGNKSKKGASKPGSSRSKPVKAQPQSLQI